MGLFSKLGKNKQDTAGQDSGYYSSADEQTMTERARSKRASSANSKGRGGRERDADDPMLPEKKRARRRLVGAVALALGVAIGLPMVLDSEPKPLASDIEIKIPPKDRGDVSGMTPVVAQSAALDAKEEIIDPGKGGRGALSLKADATISAPAAGAAATDTTAAAAPAKAAPARVESTQAEPELRSDSKARSEAIIRARQEREARAEAQARQDADYKLEVERKTAEVKAAADAKARAAAAKQAGESAKPGGEAKATEDARALAILEGKPAAKPAAAAVDGNQKFVLQVAALADHDKVEELRDKLKKAGISSFTEKTPSGDRTRVRVGPFSNKDEAEKVRTKLASMGLSGRVEAQ
ncbi:SPOR domain-containing protein [Duganella qianjiadongensis]|uniref:Sporulation protein n=1 Tax=Duganella qianjiadongensis TaxID=2692176 RepID=A0ABW9VFJ4_9BURK|nr:SPOR domain-containing protein [Duganella qianjiadongensis]MYM38291.1 sporulation protein [Duganella qianjiadongensis]